MEFYEKRFFDLMDRLVEWQKHEKHEPLELLSIHVMQNYSNPNASDYHELLIIGYIEDSERDIELAMMSGHPGDKAFLEEMNDWFKLGSPLGGTLAYYQTCGPINKASNLSSVMLDLKRKCAERYNNASISFSVPNQTNTGSSSGGGCYIATSVYGSYDCPEVWTLRRYRDEQLLSSVAGRLFVKIYYAVSPTLVKWFGKTKWFNHFWKNKLDVMVEHLKEEGYDDTPYYDR